MSQIKCIIFDCDGVLIDSEMISARIIIEELAREEIKVDFPYIQTHFLGRSFTKVAAHILDNFGVTVADDFEARYRSKLLAAFTQELRPMPGIFGVLESVDMPRCVATSSSPSRARNSLGLAGLAQYFGDNVFTASQVQNGKPAPDLFLYAAAAMRTAPAHCLVIEDSITGVEAALRAKMSVWRFTGGSHLKGVGAPPSDDAESVQVFDNWAVFPGMLAAELNG